MLDSEGSESPLRQLFGGAIVISFPTRLVDVSDFRPVPDNQEVFADGGTDQSIIVEIMESSNATATAANAAEFYYRDLAKTMEAADVALDLLQSLSHEDVPGLPEDASMSLAVGKQAVSKGRQGSETANVVMVALVAIQLPSMRSDIVITLNTPLFINPKSAAAEHTGSGATHEDSLAKALQLVRTVVKTFKIVDWSLFG